MKKIGIKRRDIVVCRAETISLGYHWEIDKFYYVGNDEEGFFTRKNLRSIAREIRQGISFFSEPAGEWRLKRLLQEITWTCYLGGNFGRPKIPSSVWRLFDLTEQQLVLSTTPSLDGVFVWGDN